MYVSEATRRRRRSAWSVGNTLIAGLTKFGIATVNALCMNRPLLVEVRSLWVNVSKHPPN
jgi:hypothetical protein